MAEGEGRNQIEWKNKNIDEVGGEELDVGCLFLAPAHAIRLGCMTQDAIMVSHQPPIYTCNVRELVYGDD